MFLSFFFFFLEFYLVRETWKHIPDTTAVASHWASFQKTLSQDIDLSPVIALASTAFSMLKISSGLITFLETNPWQIKGKYTALQ